MGDKNKNSGRRLPLFLFWCYILLFYFTNFFPLLITILL